MIETLFDVPESWWVRRRCIVCGCALSRSYASTYVVRRQGWVKIGATSNLRRRVNELSRPAWRIHILHPAEMDWEEPLEVLLTLPTDIEHELHRRFAAVHVIGEWFLDDPVIRAWVDGA